VSADGGRPLTEDERARIQVAKARGEACAGCGRDLVEGETVWFERFDVTGRGAVHWRAPVGAECVAPETLRDTCRMEPERCAGCGRGVIHPSAHPTRRGVSCSKRCRTIARRRAGKEPRS